MPVVNLPQDLGGGLKYLDDSSGKATIYEVSEAIITQLNDTRTQFNQLRTDYNAETSADHTDTTATAVTQLVDLE